MNDGELSVVGCVMGWESSSSSGEDAGSWIEVPIVLEYCPAETVLAGKINVTQRMRGLGQAGYSPVALVICDTHSAAGTLLLSTHNYVSPYTRSQLDREATEILSDAR